MSNPHPATASPARPKAICYKSDLRGSEAMALSAKLRRPIVKTKKTPWSHWSGWKHVVTQQEHEPFSLIEVIEQECRSRARVSGDEKEIQFQFRDASPQSQGRQKEK